MFLQTDAHTRITSITMKVVNVQSFPNSTNFAFVAVINSFFGVVIVEFTNTAKVLCEFDATKAINTSICDRLSHIQS